MQIRPYQQQAVDEIVDLIAKKNKKSPLLYLVTGGGKTFIAQNIIKYFVADWHKILFIVRRRRLVEQTYDRFLKVFPEWKTAMLMAGREVFWDEDAHIFIASIDTLASRIESPQVEVLNRKVSTVFIDEAHDATSKTYKSVIDLFKQRPIIGMTATPFTIGKKVHDFWDSVVHPITAYEAVRKGVLCPIDFYSPPTKIIYEDLHISSTGDFTNSSMFNAVNNKKMYGSFEKYFEEYGKNKKSITFCVNIEHSKKIEDILKNTFKIKNTFRIDSELDPFEQKSYEEKLKQCIERKEEFHLITVDMFTTGIDIPSLEVGFMLRPTKSVVVWYQQLGRLMRNNEEKDKAIILDFTKNSLTLGNPFVFDRQPDLRKDLKEKIEPSVKPQKICEKCFVMYDSILKECPNCGYSNVKGKKATEINFDETVKLIKQKEINSLKEEIKSKIKPYMRSKDWIELHKFYGDKLFELNLISKKTENFIKRFNSIDMNVDFF